MNGSADVLKTMALVATIFGAIFVVIVPLYSRNNSPIPSQVQANGEKIDQVEATADEASITAEEARRKAGFAADVRKDKICTATNEKACRALFNRLARNITEAQRFRLACAVLGALKTRSGRMMFREATCPPRLYPR